MSKLSFLFFVFFLLSLLSAQSNKPYLGLDLEETSEQGRFLILFVLPESPAEKAGLKKGDLVLALNGKKCKDLQDFSETLQTLTPGSVIELHLLREGKLTSNTLVLGETPSKKSEKKEPKKTKEPATKKSVKKAKGIYTPIQITSKDSTLEEILNQIFEESGGHIQYLSLSETVLKRRIGLSIQNLGALYAAQYACVVSEVPFRVQMIGQDKALFMIYPFWSESPKTPETESVPSTHSKLPELATPQNTPYLGLDLAEKLSEDESKKLSHSGALILNVIRFSPAETAGLKAGDLITAIGDTPIASFQDVLSKIAKAQVKDTLLFQVLREQQSVSIPVTLGPDPRRSGLLHEETKGNYDSATLREILEDLYSRTKGDFQYVATNETLSRYRFSMRVQGIHLQLFLSYLLSLIEWEYQLIQISPKAHLMLILKPRYERKNK